MCIISSTPPILQTSDSSLHQWSPMHAAWWMVRFQGRTQWWTLRPEPELGLGERPPPQACAPKGPPYTSAMTAPATHHPFCTPLFIHPLTACLFFKQDKSKGIRAGCKLLFSYSAPCQVLRCGVVHHAMQVMHNLSHSKAWLKLEENMQLQGMLGKHSLSGSLEKALLSCSSAICMHWKVEVDCRYCSCKLRQNVLRQLYLTVCPWWILHHIYGTHSCNKACPTGNPDSIWFCWFLLIQYDFINILLSIANLKFCSNTDV